LECTSAGCGGRAKRQHFQAKTRQSYAGALMVHFTSQAVKSFCTKLYEKVLESQREHYENVFISPVSIYAAMAMVLAGSEGETKREILSALQLPTDIGNDGVHNAIGSFVSGCFQSTPGVTVSVGNRGFAKHDVIIVPQYQEMLSKNYGAVLENNVSKPPQMAALCKYWHSSVVEAASLHVFVRYLVCVLFFVTQSHQWSVVPDLLKSPFQQGFTVICYHCIVKSKFGPKAHFTLCSNNLEKHEECHPCVIDANENIIFSLIDGWNHPPEVLEEIDALDCFIIDCRLLNVDSLGEGRKRLRLPLICFWSSRH
uniref:SERPIN domain-containing protein n=1 Tax=Echinostoma caproni TaxID=27848 RepID=A0A183B045_9TREM